MHPPCLHLVPWSPSTASPAHSPLPPARKPLPPNAFLIPAHATPPEQQQLAHALARHDMLARAFHPAPNCDHPHYRDLPALRYRELHATAAPGEPHPIETELPTERHDIAGCRVQTAAALALHCTWTQGPRQTTLRLATDLAFAGSGDTLADAHPILLENPLLVPQYLVNLLVRAYCAPQGDNETLAEIETALFIDEATYRVTRLLHDEHAAARTTLARIAERELSWALPRHHRATLHLAPSRAAAVTIEPHPPSENPQ